MSARQVAALLTGLDESLQAHRQVREGPQQPDRQAHFDDINAQVKACQARQQPSIAVDTTTKAVVGDFKHRGRAWPPTGQPAKVRVDDFLAKDLDKAMPSGVSDVPPHEGWVRVGSEHETAALAVASIQRWWYHMGRVVYPQAAA